jgi:hypothetical protein
MGRWLGFAVLGLVLGAALAVVAGVSAAYVFKISQSEGAYAMQVAFFFVPIGALLGLVAGLIAAGKRKSVSGSD